MQHPVSRFLTLVLLLGGCTLVFGQTQHPPEVKQQAPPGLEAKKPSQLEQMLADALRNNPDIRVGEAKLREAAAELNRTRLLVAEKVVKIQSELDLVKSKIRAAEAMLEQNRQRVKQGVGTPEEVQVAEANLVTAKAELAKLEAEVPALVGKRTGVESLAFTPDGNILFARDADGVVRIWDARTGELVSGGTKSPSIQLIPTDMTTRLTSALDALVEIDFRSTPIEDALYYLLEKAGEVPLVIRLQEKGTITLTTPVHIPLRAGLQMVQDQYEGSLEFVVRDYGVLVTEKKNLPPDAMTVQEFWKLTKKKEAEKPTR